MSVGAYTWLLFDYVTLTPQGSLMLEDVTFTCGMNATPGGIRGSLPIAFGLPQDGDDAATATKRAAVRAQVASIVEGKSALIGDRDGVIVWSGVVWTTMYDSQTEMLQVNGTEDWSIWGHRVITADLPIDFPPGTGYLGADQLFVACDILNWAQGVANGSMGLNVPSPAPVSGIPMDLKARYYEKRTVKDAIEKIAGQSNGFDFRIDVDYENGVPVRRFAISFPRRGKAAANSGLLFHYPGGNIVRYTLSTDGTQLANTVYGLGAGNADLMVAATSVNAAMLSGGYPLLETVVSYKDQATPAGIQRLTDAQKVLLSNVPYNSAPNIPMVTVRADADPQLGSYTVGDEARIRILDPMFPQGLDAFYRIVQYTVTPPTTSNQEELVTLTLGQPFTT